MAQYIDKDALLTEIERRMKLRRDGYEKYKSVSDFIAWEELEYFKEEFLPTLEVKDVDETIKNSEDHAYFADSENTREKLIDRACEWLRKGGTGWYLTSEFGENEIDFVKLAEDFRKAMEDDEL